MSEPTTAELIEDVEHAGYAATALVLRRQQAAIDALQKEQDALCRSNVERAMYAEPAQAAAAGFGIFDNFWEQCCIGDEVAKHEARICWKQSAAVAAAAERERIARIVEEFTSCATPAQLADLIRRSAP